MGVRLGTSRAWTGWLFLLSAISVEAMEPTIELELCVLDDGRATPTWTEGIAVAIGLDATKALEVKQLPLTTEARAWLAVLETALPRVTAQAPELASLFDLEPLDVVVAAGNRGSSDGFGWVPDHVGINVQAFAETYGLPGDGDVDRMTRIVLHEYIHLLTYAFYPDHLERRDTPLNRALWTMFFEGIGDFVSVSKRWWPTEDGDYSSVTARTLERLEPVLVERLEALTAATEQEEKELRRGICMGKFDEKWGSLPVALWLHSEAAVRGDREALIEMIHLERHGVLPLALRHAAPELRRRLKELAVTAESAIGPD